MNSPLMGLKQGEQLTMPIVRDDIDFSTPERKQIKFNKVLK